MGSYAIDDRDRDPDRAALPLPGAEVGVEPVSRPIEATIAAEPFATGSRSTRWIPRVVVREDRARRAHREPGRGCARCRSREAEGDEDESAAAHRPEYRHVGRRLDHPSGAPSRPARVVRDQRRPRPHPGSRRCRRRARGRRSRRTCRRRGRRTRDLARLDAAREQLLTGGPGFGDAELQALERAGLHCPLRWEIAEHDRTAGAGRRALRRVVVEVEAHLVAVERDRPVDVAHGEHDDLERPVHAVSLFGWLRWQRADRSLLGGRRHHRCVLAP